MVYSIDPSLLDVQKGQFLSIGGKKNGISRKDLITLGRYYDINRPSEIIERTLDSLSLLHNLMLDQDIPEDVYKMVSRELNAKHGHL